MATLETLDILFKSSGKDDIIKDINDIEKRWSAITASIVEKMEAINKELNKINNTEGLNVTATEKEARAKKTIAKEAKNISKTEGDVNKRIKLSSQEEKTAKQKEKYEKQREKANRSERGGSSGGSGGEGGINWGKWGGLASVASLAKTVFSKVKDASLNSRNIGASIIDIATTTGSKIEDIKGLVNAFSASGITGIGESTGFLYNLAKLFSSGYFGENEAIWEALGMTNTKASTKDFVGLVKALAEQSQNIPKGKEMHYAKGFSALGDNALRILSMSDFNTQRDQVGDIEKRIQAGKEFQLVLNQYEEIFRQLAEASLPAIKELSKLAIWVMPLFSKALNSMHDYISKTVNYLKEKLNLSDKTSDILKSTATGIGILTATAIATHPFSSAKFGAKMLYGGGKASGFIAKQAGTGIWGLTKAFAQKGKQAFPFMLDYMKEGSKGYLSLGSKFWKIANWGKLFNPYALMGDAIFGTMWDLSKENYGNLLNVQNKIAQNQIAPFGRDRARLYQGLADVYKGRYSMDELISGFPQYADWIRSQSEFRITIINNTTGRQEEITMKNGQSYINNF